MEAQVIKLRFGDDVRRLPARQLKWDDLRGKVCELYGLGAGSFRLNYVDCDGDTVLIDSAGELVEALSQVYAGDILKLTVEPRPIRTENTTRVKVSTAGSETAVCDEKKSVEERVGEKETEPEVGGRITVKVEMGEGEQDREFVEQYARELQREMDELVREDEKFGREMIEDYNREVERQMERARREKGKAARRAEKEKHKEEKRAGKEKERTEKRGEKENRKEDRREEKRAEKEKRKGNGGGVGGDVGAGPSGLYCGVDVEGLSERIAAHLLPALRKETETWEEVQMKAPVNEGREHPFVTCDVCDQRVCGVRFKCTVCPNYDMCAPCEASSNHNPHHILLKIQRPVSIHFDMEVDLHPLRHEHGNRVCCPHPVESPPPHVHTEPLPTAPDTNSNPTQQAPPPQDKDDESLPPLFNSYPTSFPPSLHDESLPPPLFDASQSLDSLPPPLLMENPITIPTPSPVTVETDVFPAVLSPTNSTAVITEFPPISPHSPSDDDEFVVVDDPSAGGPSPPSGLYPTLAPLTPTPTYPPTAYPSFERARDVTCEMDTFEGDADVTYPPIPPTAGTAPSAPPDMLAVQDAELSRLRQMLLELGFRDAARIDRHLSECGADLDTVVERLLADQ